VNTNAQVMAWMMDEYGKLHGHTPACVTGKPIALEGSYGREAATGRGVAICFQEASRELGLKPEDTTVAIQGFGNVGSNAGRILQSLGCTVVAVSDAHGAIRDDAGIDSEALAEHVADGGKLPEYDKGGAESIEPAEFMRTPCDVFIPAALGGMIHEGNAGDMECRLIIEGANSPTTPHADEILGDKGVEIVPDVLANAGGVIVSYFEWVQNLQHFRWDEEAVNAELADIMRRAYGEVRERAEKDDTTRRVASYALGMERVLEAARTRGYV
jgi:glutamate dehydrogenase (NAD(P)+)